MNTQPIDRLIRENEELAARLYEAEATLLALKSGEVDAVLIESEREQVFTLETADKPYRLLVEQLPQAAATLTLDGEVIYCNSRFAELLQRPLDSLLGRPLQDFVADQSRGLLETMLVDGRAAEVQGEVAFAREDGLEAQFYLGVIALEIGARGHCLMVTDLTERRHYAELQRTQEALRASEVALRAAGERLELAQQVGRIGTFEWDIVTGTVQLSATAEELYGVRPGAVGGYNDAQQVVHPDDRERATENLARAVADKTELDHEYRILRADGTTRWMASKGRVFSAEDGTPLRMLGVILDITDRKRAEDELLNADRRKDEFLAMLAHELRSPLAPIRNAVHILKLVGPPHQKLDWARDVIDRQVKLMARLLEDLLDVSRISRHSLELRTERVELGAVLEAALETSRPLIAASGHDLTLTIPPEPIHLTADPVRLAQVFANLLNNAAKYTEERGTIQVLVARQTEYVHVSVKDNGIGIPPDMLPHIFDVFTQSNQAKTRSQGGLGIGLSLVKGLVALHNGSIEVRSDWPRGGSEFTVRLPVNTD